MHERRMLASQLVRARALLWSSDDAETKARIQRHIAEIERKLLALDSPATGQPTFLMTRTTRTLAR